MSEFLTDEIRAEKPKKKFIALIAGCAAVVIAGMGAVYALVPAVRNSVKLAVMSPEKYYLSVEADNFANTARKSAESYQKYLDSRNQPTGADITLTFTPLGEIADSLSSAGLENIENFTLTDSLDTDTIKINQKIDIFANDVSLISGEFFSDSEAEKAYVKSDEINSDGWLMMNTSNVSEMIYGAAYTNLSGADYITNLNEDILTAAQLSDIILTYSDIFYSNAGSVEIVKDETVSAAGIEYAYNTAYVTYTSEEVTAAASAMVEEFANDTVLQNLIISGGSVTQEDIDEFIEDAREGLSEPMEENGSLVMKVYIDPEGNIRGRDFDLYSDGEIIDGDFRYVMTKQGESYGFEMFVGNYENGEDYRIELNADETSADCYSGSIRFTDNSDDIAIYFDEVSAEESGGKNFVNGTFSMTLEDSYNLSLEFSDDADNKKQSALFKVDGYAEVLMEVSEREFGGITEPSGNIYDRDNEADIEKYLEGFDSEKFIDELYSKLGIE